MMYQCEFKDAINLGTEENPDWNWSELVCEEATTTEMYELIEHPEDPEKEFFVGKIFTYGDLFFVIILTIFLFYFIGSKIFNYLWAK